MPKPTRSLTIAAITISVALVFGCDRQSERDDDPEAVEQTAEEAESAESTEEEEEEEGGDGEEDDRNARDDEDRAMRAAASTNTFAHKLFEFADDENAVFSPVSISATMAMVFAGADGDTAEQIASVLDYPEGAVEGFGALSRTLDGRDLQEEEDTIVALDLTSDVWVQDDFDIGESYLEQLQTHFDAEPTGLDFAEEPEDARGTINEHVAEETREKIDELIPEDMITEETRTVLTNAVYFKAPWASPFQKDETEEATFETPGGEVELPMMQQTEYHPVASGDGFEALSMAYRGNELAALVVLPDEGAFDEVHGDFDADTFSTTLDELGREYIRLELPRFEVRQKLTLSDTFQQMGMTDAFSIEAAFDDIHPDLFLSEVAHEAVVEVDEAGTEAAAATAAGMAVTSQPPEPTDFVVDRPFLFYIYDTSTESIVFSARVVDPTG